MRDTARVGGALGSSRKAALSLEVSNQYQALSRFATKLFVERYDVIMMEIGPFVLPRKSVPGERARL
jgi:hypothetical protein